MSNCVMPYPYGPAHAPYSSLAPPVRIFAGGLGPTGLETMSLWS